jgi:hypothetical protein
MASQPEPLTDEQLDEIEARANVATDGPWERYEKYGPDFFACTTGSYLRGVGTFNFGDGTDAEADEEFMKHAVQDVRRLVDEVRRLRAAAIPVPAADRATVLHEAADEAERVAESLRAHHEFERSIGALDVMTELRRMTDEAGTHGLDHPDCETRDYRTCTLSCPIHGEPNETAAGRVAADTPPAETQAAVLLSTRCDTCQHTLNWHRNDLGCTVTRCVCGRFQPPADEQPGPAAPAQPGKEAAHACHNCEGIDPDTCLMNPDRPS